MSPYGLLKNALKRLRASQPLNRWSTAAVHGVLAATGVRSEFVVRHLLRVGRVVVPLPNGRQLAFRTKGDDWIPNRLYWGGWDAYETETTRVFFRLAARSAVVIDVGAYIGYHALLAAHANPAGRVYTFEPLPEIFARLRDNVGLNQVPNVECIAGAVGATDGVAEFFHAASSLPSSSSLSRAFMEPAHGHVQATPVPVLTLDRFVAERAVPRVDLIKIDTETTEPEVLDGAAAVLRRDRPSIVCEVLPGHGVEQRLEARLQPLGYAYYHLTPAGPVRRDRIAGHPAWLNYLFTTRGDGEVQSFGWSDPAGRS